MSVNDSDLIERLHAVAEGFEMQPTTPADDVRRGRRRVRRNRGLVAGAVAATAAAAIGVSVVVSGHYQAGPSPAEQLKTPTPTISTHGPLPTPTPVRGELVLHLHSWGGRALDRANVELAVYTDGRVIWHYYDDQLGYHQVRLTTEGVNWLNETARSTGLFERDLALGIDGSSGDLQVRAGDRTAIVAWGGSQEGVSTRMEAALQGTGRSLDAPFVAATEAQSDALIELEEFLRDPGAWVPPPGAFERREDLPFIPTQLWMTWDRDVPDPSRLPPPAREVLSRDLEAMLHDGCAVISLAQAQEIVQAMQQVWLPGADDVTDGFAFSMPGEGGGVSYLHAHPLLPGNTQCG